jgi:DNA polymerase III delta subunit
VVENLTFEAPNFELIGAILARKSSPVHHLYKKITKEAMKDLRSIANSFILNSPFRLCGEAMHVGIAKEIVARMKMSAAHAHPIRNVGG